MLPGIRRSSFPIVILDEDTFLVSNVHAGSYDVTITRLPPGVYVSSVRLDGAETPGKGIEVGPDTAGDLIIHLGNDGAHLRGVVVNRDGEPIPKGRLVLVPSPALRGNPSQYRTAAADQSGAFAIDSVRPGSYVLLAWQPGGLDYGPLTNRDFVERYLHLGVPVDLESNGQNEVRIVLNPER